MNLDEKVHFIAVETAKPLREDANHLAQLGKGRLSEAADKRLIKKLRDVLSEMHEEYWPGSENKGGSFEFEGNTYVLDVCRAWNRGFIEVRFSTVPARIDDDYSMPFAVEGSFSTEGVTLFAPKSDEMFEFRVGSLVRIVQTFVRSFEAALTG